jgi:alpha-1,6-mannosyltransferase
MINEDMVAMSLRIRRLAGAAILSCLRLPLSLRSLAMTNPNPFFWFAVSWVVLAVPSLFHLPGIIKNNCYFFDSYLTCQPSSTLSNISNTFFIGLILATVFFFYLRLVNDGFRDFIFSRQKWLIFLLFSSLIILVPFATFDPFYYLGVGRDELLKGINPYIDNFVRYNPFATKYQLTEAGGVMYFPLWLYINKLIVLFSFGQIWLSLLWYKLVMLTFHLLTSWMVYLISKEIKLEKPSLPALLYFFNPLMLFEFVGQAHFDPIMLFFSLVGLYFLVKNNFITAIFWLSLAILTKALAAYFLPFFLLFYLVNNRQNLCQALLRVLIGGMLSLLLAVVFFAPYWAGLAIFDGIRWQTKWIANTLFSGVHAIAALLAEYFDKTNLVDHLVPRVLQVGFSITFLAYVYRLFPSFLKKWLNKEKIEPLFLIASIVVFLIGYLFFFQRSFWPWYASWPFVFSVFLVGTRYDYFFKTVLILTISSLFYYLIPLLFGYWSIDSYSLQILVSLVIFIPPLVYLIKMDKLARNLSGSSPRRW